jgi:hypothetical protein
MMDFLCGFLIGLFAMAMVVDLAELKGWRKSG